MRRALARRWPLPVLLLLALVARLATLAVPSIHHPDEIYQYLEAAHRIVFGYGIVPWEYRVGMRSWLLPLLLSGPMALGGALAPKSALYLLLPRLMMIAVSTSIVGSAWVLGARISRTHAAFAAFVAAIWYELIAIAAHPLGESIGLATACAAAALACGGRRSTARLAGAGGFLALTCVLRFQYGPAMLVLAAFAGGRRRRETWLPMAAGAGAVLTVAAAVDLAFGATPFFWLVENVRQNILLDKAAGFGTAPPAAYIGVLGNMWSWASVPIVITAYVGGRRYPALFWAAVVHFGLHSLIGHKEYRFILLTSGFAILLAGIGTVDLIDAARRRTGNAKRRILLTAAAVIWLAASVLLGARWDRRPMWTLRAASLQTFAAIRTDPAVCGVGLIGATIFEFGGYTAMHRPVPLYLLPDADGEREIGALSPAFNTLVTTPTRADDAPADYRPIGCRSTKGEYVGRNFASPQDAASLSAICLYRRPGGCDAAAQHKAAPLTVNRTLIAVGM